VRRVAVVAAVLLAAAAPALSGCGGGGDDGGTSRPATATAPASGVDASDLPALDAVPGVAPGSVRALPDARSLVDALYRPGDPGTDAAVARLQAAGYAGGILRDQPGTDPATGPLRLREYAFAVRDPAAAEAEADAEIREVAATAADARVSPVAGGRMLQAALDGAAGTVIVVAWSRGATVHGLQAIAARGVTLPRDAIVAATGG
jgi:hypothetical protein